MEIDFPSSSREEVVSPEELSQDELLRFLATPSHQNEDVEESILSGVTSTSSRYEGGGSLLWPSTDDEGNKKKKHHSKRKSSRHRRRQRRRQERTTTATTESQTQNPRRRLSESSYTSSNYEVGAGEIAVDFPADRTPFIRRRYNSSDEYGMNDFLDESLNLVVTEGMKEQQQSSSGASNEGSNNNSNNRRGGPIRRRSSLGSRGSLGSRSSVGSRSRSSDSLNSRRIRRRGSIGSRSSAGYDSNDSSADALNAFLHHQQRSRSRGPEELTKSLETIHSEMSVTQSLRELELRRTLRESLLRRNKSMNNLEGMPRTGSRGKSLERSLSERRPSMGSLERRPSEGDLLEAEAEQKKSLVAAHNATVAALPIVGWDVENQSDTSSFLGSSGGKDDPQSGGLQRSFRRASFTSKESFEHDSAGPEHHGSIHPTLLSSLNNNNADNPNPDGQMLFEEFVSRGSFQKKSNSMFAEDGGNSRGQSPVEPPLIMEEEYDPRKPWRKAPAVAVNCRNRRATNATFRSSMNSSMNFEDFLMSMDSQQLQKEVNGDDEEDQKDQQQQQEQIDYNTDQDKSMPSSRSSRSLEYAPDTPTEATAAATPVVNELPSNSPMEDASSSTARRAHKADESTVLSSLAGDNDDDSELTELRHAQEALFPIQEGGFKKKLSEGYDDASELRHSELSDAVSGVSFGIDALENSEQIIDDSERKVAHRNDFSLDIVQEEDERIVQERILQKKEQQKQQRIEDIILEQEKLHKQQEEEEELERKRRMNSEVEISKRRNTLSSDDFGANQIREDLQLDDLPSSAGDIFNRRKISQDDNDTFSDLDNMEANVTTSKTRVCINHTDESIEEEFATTKLEDIEFGHRESKLYQDENDLDVSELGLLFEASRNEDILKDDSSRHSGFTSSKTGSRSGSRKTASTLESAMRPIKKVMMRSASTLDTKATSNIRRRNKRLWKFCVWNCRKITMCAILLIGILVAIGVLAWLGAVKNKQVVKNPGEDGTVDKETATKISGDGNGLEGVEQPLVAEPEFILQPLMKGSTYYPSLSPSQSSSQPSTPTLVQDGLGKLEPSPVNDTASLAGGSAAGNETDADNGAPAISAFESFEAFGPPSTVPSVSPPVAATLFLYPTKPPVSINVPKVETDILGVMTFSEPVPQDSEANLIMFLDALKKSIRSAVSPSLDSGDQLRYVEIISINGKAVESLLIRRRFLGRWLQTGASVVVFNVVILTECDFSLCTDVDAVADDVLSRVQNAMTTSVISGAFASSLNVAMVSSSGGTIEYVTAVELGDFREPTVSVLSPTGDYQANETSTTDMMAPDDVNSTTNGLYSSTLVGNQANVTDSTTIVDVDPKANETNLTLIVNETTATSANESTTTNATSITDSSSEDGNEPFTTNATIADNNVTSNSVVTAGEDETIALGDNETLPPYLGNSSSTTDGLEANETLPSFANLTVGVTESLPAESAESSTITFNVSALDALFFPSP
eukprot:scaffold9648_cov144-Skeletonema_menzelii.AAC.2